ncbi:MAG TPA: tRNA (adenosine(37)-N6)-threonylcarbamoyltransferase complex dimerization subunit type 1 TsaB [Rhizomicrobium sp.]|nr:tRNA (adenosine(37)-N6)-threonylcarbamoyltransferase complex dimerization subunit type 1 TsaB [Rhizomicrobium sp.]
MKILAVDTALGACSVAIIDNARVLSHRWVAMPRGHAEALAPMIEEALREAGIGFADLERLGVTTGPGTFTGQRVGLAFMRGLRLALGKPLVGVTTLEAMAAAAAAQAAVDPIAVLHEAKRGEVYAALFVEGKPTIPVQVAEFESFMEELDATAHGQTLVLAGTAAEAAAAWLGERGKTPVLTEVRQPDALWVARLADAVSEPGETARPLYLRSPDARLAAAAIRLRPAVAADSTVLAELYAACLTGPWDAGFFAQTLESSGGFGTIAEAHGATLGFVLGRAAADEAEILAIGVLPAYRRSGVGHRLLAEAGRRAAELGAARLFLEVATDNLAARALYHGLGFSEAGKRKSYYGTGGDALILRGDLPLARLGNDPKLA